MTNEADINLFNCLIEDPEKYIQLLSGEFNEDIDELYLSDRKFLKNILVEEIGIVTKYLRKQWMFIQNLVLLDNNLSFKEVVHARNDLNKGMKAILQCICKQSEYSERRNKLALDAINSIAVSVLSLESFDDKILMKLCYSSKQNTNCPIHEYFHSYLDIQFHILLLLLRCGSPRNAVEDYIVKIMTDMIILSRKYFLKECTVDNSFFLCPCIKHFWLLLVLISEDKLGVGTFWDKFNMVLKEDDALFSFWLLRDIAGLLNFNETSEVIDQGDRLKLPPNYIFMKEKLKDALSTSNEVLKHLKIIYTLVCELWMSENRVEIFLLLWDHFSKRLNISTKYQPGLYLSCTEFTELLDTIIYSPKDCNEEFEFFIGMLLNYLKQHPNHWSKIKCRIFSQLGPFKMGELGKVGIYRVLELFIGLMQVNQEELSKKIVSVYGSLKEEMITPVNINVYVSFIIRHVRANESIEKITAPLVKTLQRASEDQNTHHLVKEFLNGFQLIVNISNNMQLHQWTLLDSWIIRYMATCFMCDLEAAAKILLLTVRKINCEDSWSYWEIMFKKNIYPVLKQIGTTSSCPPIVGELAGEISSLSPDLLQDAFSFFNSPEMNHKVTEKYLCTILKYYPTNISLTELQEKCAMQSWVEICLYSPQNFKEITSSVMKLENIPSCIKEGMNNTSDPLETFIEHLGTNKGLFATCPILSRFCEMCFDNLDQSLAIHLPQIKNDMVILRIYTYLALALLQCGTLIYDRHKTSSPATKLISCLLFPTEFMMGKISHPFLNAIRKTWHIYFEALLKLSADNDTYIQRNLRDLIAKYLPHYSVSDSPIYLCLNRENSATVILEKMCSIYFKLPKKEHELNVTKALKILNEYVKSSTSAEILKIVVAQTMFGLCEVYIFHNQRNLALSIIMHLVTCPFYNQIKQDVLKVLLLLTEKHLAFNSKAYFNLINILGKTIPSDILILKENIVDKIRSIEEIRGIGHDEILRGYLSTLNNILNC